MDDCDAVVSDQPPFCWILSRRNMSLLRFTTASSSLAERGNHPTIEIENYTDTVVSVNEPDHVGRHNRHNKGSVNAEISCTNSKEKMPLLVIIIITGRFDG
jgi:hypothetical protein